MSVTDILDRLRKTSFFQIAFWLDERKGAHHLAHFATLRKRNHRMAMKFSARQTSVNTSELERLTGRGTGGVAALASACGNPVLSGHPVSTNVGGAVNVLVLSIAADHGVELPVMRQWLPGLRTETLLTLAQAYDSWYYDGPVEHEQTFYSMLAGPRSAVRAGLAPLLGVNAFDARALLRFHSQSDVEFLSNEELEGGHSGRLSLFNIYASTLVERIQEVCRRPLFVGSPKGGAYS